MTYLELCQKMIRDLGLGVDISTVAGQTGMQKKITDWVADADEAVQTLWTDWQFLWSQNSTTTIASTLAYAPPSDWGEWDYNSFYLDYTTDDYVHLTEMDYLVWRETCRNGTQTNDKPSQFIIAPDNNIYLDPIPDDAYTLTSDYWATPTRLSADSDSSAIPGRFQRIILAQAKIYYAEHDEFPAVLELASSEYRDLIRRLEAAELPGGARAERRSDASHLNLVIQPE